MKAPLPADEAERLKTLHSYDILDTKPEQDFDDITLLASHICVTPIAMISLVDETRQWFKSKIGLTQSETARDIAFCAHGILEAEVMVVEDTLKDKRFETNPLVTGVAKVRFYAGAPLIASDGHALGMLCVNDQVPREISEEQKAALQALSRQVVAQLELRRTVAQLKTTIEERTRAEMALRRTEDLYRRAIDGAGAVPYSNDFRKRKYLFMGEGIQQLIGYAPHEVNSALWAKIVQKSVMLGDGAGLEKAEAARRVIAGELLHWRCDMCVTTRDGQTRWISDASVQERDEQGHPLFSMGILQDITERKVAEESMRLLTSAMEQSKESIVITDASLDQPGPRIIFVNPAFTKMTGYTAAEAQGQTPRLLQGPRTDRAVLDRLRTNLARGELFSGEAINYRKDGTEFQLEWQIAPLRNATGTVTHFVAIQRDITERKRLEAQLFQSQKMETVGKLAGGIAHEFNSIMTAIIGQSELLLEDLPAADPLRKNAAEISKAANRAATLTRQLLAYGRKQILQPEILNFNAVLASIETVLHHLMGRNTDLRVIPAPELKNVKVDAGQIEQVIVNLAMNAADAMPNGGKLTLETANVTLDKAYVSQFPELIAGNYVMLAVSDTGTGMSEEVKARVFEPFFTTKDVGEGTGLGLATCHGIIKQSGGHLAVYSEPGRGTTFKIYLPQVESLTSVSAPPPIAATLPHGTETILLVEDDPALREMAAKLLGRLGYIVLTAGNGVEALTLAQQPGTGRIDLLFTDVVMPHMSGKELADRVQSLFSETKILFTSAYTEGAIVHQGTLHPGVQLLHKPFTPSALAHKVREVLGAKKTVV